jgi:AbrB family looped-hinge helix DNA binding protein
MDQKRRIVLPAEVAEELDLHEGSEVEFEKRKGSVVLKKASMKKWKRQEGWRRRSSYQSDGLEFTTYRKAPARDWSWNKGDMDVLNGIDSSVLAFALDPDTEEHHLAMFAISSASDLALNPTGDSWNLSYSGLQEKDGAQWC